MSMMKPGMMEEIKKAIDLKLKTANCPCCGNNNWGINGIYILYSQSTIPSGGMIIGGNQGIDPYIVISCSHCGYSRLHGLVLLIGKERLHQLMQADHGEKLLDSGGLNLGGE
jgi:predicted nucleic-acid-binding Zn-ribbon protein